MSPAGRQQGEWPMVGRLQGPVAAPAWRWFPSAPLLLPRAASQRLVPKPTKPTSPEAAKLPTQRPPKAVASNQIAIFDDAQTPPTRHPPMSGPKSPSQTDSLSGLLSCDLLANRAGTLGNVSARTQCKVPCPCCTRDVWLRLVRRGISRFPSNDLPHMPGSSTTLAHVHAPKWVAFRIGNGVGTWDMTLCEACSFTAASPP